MNRTDEIYGPIYDNIKTYHKNVDDDFLDKKTDHELMCWCHPIKREEFKKLLGLTTVIEDYLYNLDEQDRREINGLDNLG